MRRRRVAGPAALLVAMVIGCGGGDGAPDREEAEVADGSGRLENEAGLELRRLAELRSPTHIAQPPGVRDLLFVTEKRGIVRVLVKDQPRQRPFLDLRKYVRATGTEQGLVSIAFPPGYRTSRRFYVAYTDDPAGNLRIDEFRTRRKDRLRARRGTRRRVLEISQPEEIHNGGMLAFGPDRRLYVGVGDGGPSYDPDNVAQRRKSLLGKLLRIEPRRAGKGRPYGIPRGNPFRGRGGANEVYAYGLRNPWRFSFDRRTGALLVGDVGQDQIEEIDYVRPARARGANFGWSGWEGTRPFKEGQQRGNAVFPIHEYAHGDRCSVTGGYVIRDPRLPSLAGRYIYGDVCDGELRSLIPPSGGGSKKVRREGLRVPALVSFGEDDRARIYAISLEGGVYRLVERAG